MRDIKLIFKPMKSKLERIYSQRCVALGFFAYIINGNIVYADPAVFFDSDIDAGRTNFQTTVNSTVGSGTTPEIFSFNFATMTDSGGNIRSFTLDNSSGTPGTGIRTVQVEGSAGTVVTVAMSSAVTNQGFWTFGSTTGANGYSVDYDDSTYELADWDEVVDEGFNLAFTDGSNQPFLINGVGIEVNDWGTCCVTQNVSSDGTPQAGTAVYAVFDPAANPNTVAPNADIIQIGNLTGDRGTFAGVYADGTTANDDNHFVAAINDVNAWSSVAIVPNGEGEFFGFGGILYFSRVALNSVPAGSSVVTVGQRDITLPTDSHTGLGTATSFVFNGGVLSVGADLSANFSIKSGGGAVSVAAGTTRSMSGVIGNDGSSVGALAKVGDGRLILSGDNTYTGTTTISAGTLQLNGSLTSDITVNLGATLSGFGATSGTLTSSGRVAPGNLPGTLTVSGDVVFTSTNSFDVDIDGSTYDAAGGAGTYDRLAITGASSTFTADGIIAPIVRGITAPANNTFTPVIGDTFRVVTTANANGVSGAFSTVTQPTAGMLTNTRFDVIYGASFVDLVITAADLGVFASTGGGNQNTVRAATALQSVRPSAGAALTGDAGDYWAGLYGLGAAETLVALEQTSGQIHAYALSELRASNIALARFDPAATLRAAADEALWVMIGNDQSNIGADQIASGYHSDGRNSWIGVDLENTNDRRYGVALGYADRDITTAAMGSADTNTRSVLGYYFGESDNWDYSGLLSFGFTDVSTLRNISMFSGDADNTSNSSAKSQLALLQVGYTEAVSEEVRIRLSADVLRLHTEANGFTETGSATTAVHATTERQAETRFHLAAGMDWSPLDLEHSVIAFNAGVELRDGHDRISDRDLSLHSANWEVEVPHVSSRLGFLEVGLRTTLGDLLGSSMTDADDYRINGNVRYTRDGIYENTSVILGISRAF